VTVRGGSREIAWWILRAHWATGIALLGLFTDVSRPALLVSAAAWVAGAAMDRAGTPREALSRLGTPLSILLLAAACADLALGSRDLLASMSLLVLGVQSIRLVLPKRARDGWQLCAIALLEFLAAAASTDALLFAPSAFLFLAASAGAMWGLHLQGETEEGRAAPGYEVPPRAVASALLLAGTVGFLICGALFAIVPRLEFRKGLHPFFRNQGMTGFSETLSLGEVTGGKADRRVVARVEFPVPPRIGSAEGLYLRGAVYSRFQSGAWRIAGTPGRTLQRAGNSYVAGSAPRGESLFVADIALEPSSHPVLFTYGQPVLLEGTLGAVRADGEGNLTLPQAGHPMLRYRVQFAPEIPTPRPPLSSPGKGYLEIPDGLEDVIALGRKIAGEGTDVARAGRLLRFFGTGFRYTVLDPAPSLRDFLLARRAGHCEHFAAALVVLLRSAGIPSRVAVGYLGGEWSDMGQYLIVRQSDAHAWTEAWIGGRWMLLDATPALGENSPFLVRTGKLGLFVDWTRQRWDKYVVNYSLRMQADAVAGGWSAARRTGRAIRFPEGSRVSRGTLRISAATGLAFGAFLLLYRNRKRSADGPSSRNAERLPPPYARLARRLERSGYRPAPGISMEGMLRAAARSRPDLSGDVGRFLALYHRDRFGPRPLSAPAREEAFGLATRIRREVASSGAR